MTAPNPLTAVAADPTRDRVLVAYQDGASRVLALQPRGSGRAEVEASTTIRTVNVTLAVANDAIWLAGFSTGGGALVRLDQTTLRPTCISPMRACWAPVPSWSGKAAASVWVRDGVGGPELRCVDARSGAQSQTWQLDGLVSSTAGRAGLGTGDGGAEDAARRLRRVIATAAEADDEDQARVAATRRPSTTPRAIMPAPSTKCSQLSAVLTGTKLAELIWSITSP